MLSILLYKELLWFGMDISLYKNTSTFLGLSRDKTKGQPGKNTSLTLTKTLPTKYKYSFSNPLLQSNYTFEGTLFFFLLKKNTPHLSKNKTKYKKNKKLNSYIKINKKTKQNRYIHFFFI